MYRDKEKQRDAVRLATRRWRERKGITRVSPEKVSHERVSLDVMPSKEVETVTPSVKHLSWDELKGRSAVRGK